MNRRSCLTYGLALAATCAGKSWAEATTGLAGNRPYLDIQRASERYRLNIFSTPGLEMASWLLRDANAGSQAIPDPRLLQVLVWTQQELERMGHVRTMVVSSGMRTHETNARIEGAALRSYHLPDQDGIFRAVDIFGSPQRIEQYYQILERVPGLGLGIYPGHIHVDTRGRDSRWSKS